VALVSGRRHRTELHPEWRAGDIFGDLYRGCRWRRDDEPPEARGTEIGLLPFGNQLLQPGLGPAAVQDVVGGGDRRRIDGAAGEDVTIADLGVQNADDRGQFGLSVLLADGLPAAGQVSAGVPAAALCTCPPVSDSDCSAVLAAEMMVLTLVIGVAKGGDIRKAATAPQPRTPR